MIRQQQNAEAIPSSILVPEKQVTKPDGGCFCPKRQAPIWQYVASQTVLHWS